MIKGMLDIVEWHLLGAKENFADDKAFVCPLDLSWMRTSLAVTLVSCRVSF